MNIPEKAKKPSLAIICLLFLVLALGLHAYAKQRPAASQQVLPSTDIVPEASNATSYVQVHKTRKDVVLTLPRNIVVEDAVGGSKLYMGYTDPSEYITVQNVAVNGKLDLPYKQDGKDRVALIRFHEGRGWRMIDIANGDDTPGPDDASWSSIPTTGDNPSGRTIEGKEIMSWKGNADYVFLSEFQVVEVKTDFEKYRHLVSIVSFGVTEVE